MHGIVFLFYLMKLSVGIGFWERNVIIHCHLCLRYSTLAELSALNVHFDSSSMVSPFEESSSWTIFLFCVTVHFAPIIRDDQHGRIGVMGDVFTYWCFNCTVESAQTTWPDDKEIRFVFLHQFDDSLVWFPSMQYDLVLDVPFVALALERFDDSLELRLILLPFAFWSV